MILLAQSYLFTFEIQYNMGERYEYRLFKFLLRIMGTIYYIGWDVHKKVIDYCIKTGEELIRR